MSGKPHPKGVERVVGLLGEIQQLNVEDVELQKAEERAKELREQRTQKYVEMTKLIREMDLESVGNHGFEHRFSWFLSEMRRQLLSREPELSPHDQAALAAALKQSEELEIENKRLSRELGEAQTALIAATADKARAEDGWKAAERERVQRGVEIQAIEDLNTAQSKEIVTLNEKLFEKTHKLDDLVMRFNVLEAECRRLSTQLTAVKTDRDGVYVWEGNMEVDKPESLVCPVVMTADTLRDLLSKGDVAIAERAKLEEGMGQLGLRVERFVRLAQALKKFPWLSTLDGAAAPAGFAPTDEQRATLQLMRAVLGQHRGPTLLDTESGEVTCDSVECWCRE